jgi:hypothetical protein
MHSDAETSNEAMRKEAAALAYQYGASAKAVEELFYEILKLKSHIDSIEREIA